MLKRLHFLLLLLFLYACSAQPINLTPGERAALETLDLALASEASEGEAIWPGFSLVGEPILIHRPGARSFLVAAPASVEGVDVAPGDLRHLPRVIAVPSAEIRVNPSVLFSRDVPVRGVEAFMIRHTDGTKRLRFYRLLVHEIFHLHQLHRFVRNREEPLCRYPMEDGEFVAGALIEQRRLARSLSAGSDDDARRGLRQVLANRLARYEDSLGGLTAQGIEEWEERLEGTARYVEELYAIAAGLLDHDAAVQRLAASLQGLAPKDLQKWRYYRTGEALLLLVRRLLPEPVWQQQVDDGRSLLEVAIDAVGAPEVAPMRPDAEALDKALEVVSGPLAAHLKHEQALLNEWPRQGTLHIRVIASTAGAVTYSGRGVTFHLPDCSRFISRVSWFVDRAAGLDVRDRSIVLDGARGRDAYHLEFHGDLRTDTPLLLDGVPVRQDVPGARDFDESIRVIGERWGLDHCGAGRLELHGDGLRIELFEIAPPAPWKTDATTPIVVP
ncbi:MAG: hypothetical protein ABIK09_09765 [Pseudomonadota bacterium]